MGRDGLPVDNRWIVPHNLWLSTKYNAHINVEVCSSVAAVKYLFKYVYKGHDKTKMAIHPAVARHRPRRDNDVVNEVEDFQDSRYVSACEALWRIFKFRLHARSPSVKRLQVHLEDHQTVSYQEDADLQDVVNQDKDSPLMGWFKLNARDPQARHLTYPEIPKHYTWSNYQWRRRRAKRSIITRMYFVHPRDRERFCLRLLLLTAKGATSFQDLRTVPDPHDNTRNIVFETFREAALARELLDSDQEWTNLLQEAAVDQMPNRLRHLFAWILCHCAPSDPLQLWHQFASDLSLDYLRQRLLAHPMAQDAPSEQDTIFSRNATLSDINRTLIEMGSSLESFPELLAQFTGDNLNQFLIDFAEPEQQPAINNYALFNHGQRMAFDRIVDAIQGQPVPKKIFFIDGPGGTGKSFLYNTLIAHVHGLNQGVIAVASSGIAALILHGGRTAHSTFKVPLKIHSDSTCNIPTTSDLATRICNAAVIIWDEAPMMHRHLFEAVDRTFRDVTKVDAPFGGKVVVFGGDFRQVTPVVQRGSQAQIENACLRFAQFWPNVETLKLTENMRVVQDPQNEAFIQFLLRVGEGNEPTFISNSQDSFIRIPDQYIVHPIPPNTTDQDEVNSSEKQFIQDNLPWP